MFALGLRSFYKSNKNFESDFVTVFNVIRDNFFSNELYESNKRLNLALNLSVH